MSRFQQLLHKKEFLEHMHARQTAMLEEEVKHFLQKRWIEMKSESPKADDQRRLYMLSEECGLDQSRMMQYLRSYGVVSF